MTGSRDASSAVRRPRLSQAVCLVLGLVFTTVGVLGLVEGGFDGMGNVPASVSGATVNGLGGSPFLNLAHLTFGLLAIGASVTDRGPRLVAVVGLVALTATIAYDVVALAVGSEGEPLSLEWPALVLHVVGWSLALSILVLAYRAAVRNGREPNLSLTNW